MRLLDRCCDLILIGRIGPDGDRPHPCVDRGFGRSFRRLARAAIDQRQITPARGEAVSDNLSDAGPTGD